MVITLQIVSIIFSILVLIQASISLKRMHTLVPIIIVFDFVMVVPTFLELIWGIPKIPYQTLQLAENDETTNVIFCLFLIISQALFWIEIKRLKKIDKLSLSANSVELNTINIYKQTLRYKTILLFLSYITPVIVIVSMLIAPDPLFFLNLFSDPSNIMNQQFQFYYIKYMGVLVYALLLSVIILKWYDNSDHLSGRLIRIFYVLLIMMAIHKRTFMMIAIGACLVVDIVKGKKKRQIFFWYTLYILIAAFYFIYYAYGSGKASYNDDWYYEFNEYFFRSMHMKFAIYAALNPTRIHILDYPGQSILFDLFYFVPRSIWVNKPWPYVYYFISGVMGYSSYQFVPWQMPPSYYPEFVSNFGILGIFFSLIFTIWMSRFLDRRSIVCKILGTALICLLEIYYYDNALKILVFLIIALYFMELRKKKRASKLLIKN